MDNIFNNDKFEQYIDQLAELVFVRLIHKYGDVYPLNFVTDKEEILVGELARLNTQLNMLEHRQEYEKCAIIQNRIDKIEKKLRNL